MLTKSQLKELFRKHDFRPLKRLGENYLTDRNIKDKIMAEAGISKADCVLEIGSGLGALTVDLAMTQACVYAVEKDRKAFAILKEISDGAYPNIRLINADILKFDFGMIRSSRKIKVIGNLPYYITTPIIEYLIERRARIESMLIVIQKEVCSRLLASPGSKDSSSISCYVQYYTKVKYLHAIDRTSFYPTPGVDSGLLRLDVLPRPSVDVRDEALFFRIIRGAFNQRRKSIINSLSRIEALNPLAIRPFDITQGRYRATSRYRQANGHPERSRGTARAQDSILSNVESFDKSSGLDPERGRRVEGLNIPKDKLIKILTKIGIDPSSRPESLTLSDFARISNAASEIFILQRLHL